MEFLENKLIEFESELGILLSKNTHNMDYYEFTEDRDRIDEIKIIIKFLKETMDEI